MPEQKPDLIASASRSPSILRIVQAFLSCLPAAWLLGFALFVVRAYARLGYFPAYGHPDPEDLGFTIQYALLFWGMFAVVLSPFVWLPVTIYLFFRKQTNYRNVILFLVFYVFLLLFLRMDFGGWIDWFTD